MPTIVTHALLPLLGAAAFPQLRLPPRLVVAAMAAAMLPDADIISRAFGVPHTHDFGHRGATHTAMFALLVGALAAWRSDLLRVSGWTAFLVLFLATLSHPLADMLTDGGKGIMLFWPLEEERLKWLVHPIAVSPIGLRGFEDGRIWSVFASELLWLWLPLGLVALALRWFGSSRRRPRTAAIDLSRRQT